MSDILDSIKDSLVKDASILLQPGERVYWLFLLGGLGVALGVWAVLRATGKLKATRGPLAFLFPKRIWLHRSAILDYKLLIVRGIFRALLVAPWLLSAYAIAIGVVALLDRNLGVPTAPGLSTLQIVSIYTLVAFLANDFSRWFLHMLLHKVPWLWQLHQVHHSAEVMTPVTLYRAHPIETLMFNVRGVAVNGSVAGLFFSVFRSSAVQWEIGGVAAIGYAFSLLGANLRHSHIWLSYGRKVEHFLISPAQHQIHHSTAFEDYDTNYGSFLAIWDWAFGSLRSAAGRPRVVSFGLSAEELNHHPHRLGSSLVAPLVAIMKPKRAPAGTASSLPSPR
jgi:sterol desaturase/sphingolipid hydroxylase (fatty acid hydroxylase superfamily)